MKLMTKANKVGLVLFVIVVGYWLVNFLFRDREGYYSEKHLASFSSRIKTISIINRVYNITLNNGYIFQAILYPSYELASKYQYGDFISHAKSGDSVYKLSGSDSIYVVNKSGRTGWRIYFP